MMGAHVSYALDGLKSNTTVYTVLEGIKGFAIDCMPAMIVGQDCSVKGSKQVQTLSDKTKWVQGTANKRNMEIFRGMKVFWRIFFSKI